MRLPGYTQTTKTVLKILATEIGLKAISAKALPTVVEAGAPGLAPPAPYDEEKALRKSTFGFSKEGTTAFTKPGRDWSP